MERLEVNLLKDKNNNNNSPETRAENKQYKNINTKKNSEYKECKEDLDNENISKEEIIIKNLNETKHSKFEDTEFILTINSVTDIKWIRQIDKLPNEISDLYFLKNLNLLETREVTNENNDIDSLFSMQSAKSQINPIECICNIPVIEENTIINDSWIIGIIFTIGFYSKDLINNIILTPLNDIKQYGVYTCQFYKDCKWIEIICDTKIPFIQSQDNNILQPLHSHCIKDKVYTTIGTENIDDIILQLIIKAYGKLYKGYENLNKINNISETIIDLTGGSVNKYEVDNISNKMQLWEIMLDINTKNRGFMCCQYKCDGRLMRRGSNYEEGLTDNGIYYNHLYIVQNIVEISSNQKFIKLVNIWKKGSWTGNWCNEDAQWDKNTQLSKLLKRENTSKTMWIIWEDFIRNFNEIYISRVYNEQQYHTYVARKEWIGNSAAGPPNDKLSSTTSVSNTTMATTNNSLSITDKEGWIYSTKCIDTDFFLNPQFKVTCKEKTRISISLLQRDYRLYNGDNFSINFIVLEQNSRKVEKNNIWEFSYEQIVCQAHSMINSEINITGNKTGIYTSFPEREISFNDLVLLPKKKYYIIAYTDHPKVEMEFFLRIFSRKPIRFESLLPVYHVSAKGKWGTISNLNIERDVYSNSGGPLQINNKENLSWIRNPQYYICFSPEKASSPKVTKDTSNQKLANIKIVLRRATLDKKSSIASSNMISNMNINLNPPSPAANPNKIKAKEKDLFKDNGNYVGLLIVKPDINSTPLSNSVTKTNSKLNKTKTEKFEDEKNNIDCNIERKLVLSPDEWCYVSPYISPLTTGIYLSKLTNNFISQGLIVIPTLNNINYEGAYDIDIYSDMPTSCTEIECNKNIKSLEGEWNTLNSFGSHLNVLDFKRNPKFYLKLKSIKPVNVNIILTRSEKEWNKKIKSDPVGSMFGFYLIQGYKLQIDKTISTNTAGGKILSSWNHTDFKSGYYISTPPEGIVLQPLFAEPYIIIPTTYEQQKFGRFIITVKADCPYILSTEDII